MNIGDVSRESGVSTKMIRYYEQIGLIAPAHRTESGYRVYRDSDVHTLCFIRRARDLGFSVNQLAELLALWSDRHRASADVKRIAREHIAELERKIQELRSMTDALKHLAEHCHGDHRPECPILEDLVGAIESGASASETELAERGREDFWPMVALHRSEDETESRDTETVCRDGHQGHPPRHPQAVWSGREDPRRAGRSTRRGIDRRAMPTREIAESLYYNWSKEFLEASKKRLAGDTASAATTDEVNVLRRETRDLKESSPSRRRNCDCSKKA